MLRGWRSFCTAGEAGRVRTPHRSHALISCLRVESPTHHPGSYPPASTSSAGRPGTGSGGPCPQGTFLPPPGTCRRRGAPGISVLPRPEPWALHIFAVAVSSLNIHYPSAGGWQGSPTRGPCPPSPVNEPPSHASLEEAAAAVAGVDAIVLPTAAVSTHAALERGSHA